MQNYSVSVSNPAVTLNTTAVYPVKYTAYPTSSLGTVQLDENTDLSHERKFLNLYTLKSSWDGFTKVVNTVISELTTNTPSQVIAVQNNAIDAQASAPAMGTFAIS